MVSADPGSAEHQLGHAIRYQEKADEFRCSLAPPALRESIRSRAGARRSQAQIHETLVKSKETFAEGRCPLSFTALRPAPLLSATTTQAGWAGQSVWGRQAGWAVQAAGLVVALAWLAACGGSGSPPVAIPGPDPATAVATIDPALPPLPPSADQATPAEPVVAWSAHAGAKLEPCGCVAGMHGGLARRATLLGRVAAERRISVELGGWSGGSADYQVLRAQFYLGGAALAGIDAVALGEPEVRLGRSALARILAHPGVPPVVCANLRVTGAPLAVQPVLRLRRGGVGYAITAVAPAHAQGEGLVADEPAEALARLLPTLAGERVIVLADLDEAGCERLARAVPGLALVVGGAVKQPSQRPLAVGPARVVYAANEGKTIGWWRWGAADCGFELIGDRIPDQPQVRALIRKYQENLGAMDLAVDERIGGLTTLPSATTATSGTAAAATRRYVGDAACTACHATAAKVHAASRHAHALASLSAKGYQNDPDCLRCHVTGLGLPDGYQRRGPPRPHTALVSCESCHGRGSVHASERAAGRAASGSLDPITPATCVRCHDGENSPKFVYDLYWNKIRHGK